MEFGYNCKYLLPMWDKCRKAIDDYLNREDLVEEKSLNLKELVVYLNLSKRELIEQIKKKKLKLKRIKVGKLEFKIFAPWEYDECPLANTGGQCYYYKPHEGKKISCIADRELIKEHHPNTKLIPDENELMQLEKEIISTF